MQAGAGDARSHEPSVAWPSLAALPVPRPWKLGTPLHTLSFSSWPFPGGAFKMAAASDVKLFGKWTFEDIEVGRLGGPCP